MKRTTFFKSLLLAAGLSMGANAWAGAGDVTTNANIDFSNAITEGVVAGSVNSMTVGGSSYIDGDKWLRLVDATSTVTIPTAQRAGSKDVVNVKFKMGWGNKKDMGSKFELKDADNQVLATFTYARWADKVSNSNNLNINMSGLVGGAASNAPIKARYTLFDVTVDYAARTITSVVFCSNTDGKGTTRTETFNASLTNTNPIATFEVTGFGVGGNTDRADAIDELVITTTEGDYSVVTYDYTVNWVCDGTTVKSAVRQGEKDATISLFDTDKTAFTESGTKYFYVSDDVSGKTVADDGSTVVTVTVRKAENWKYTINAVDEANNLLGEISTGTVVEGEGIYYYYPIYFLNGTDLLQADINDKSYGKGATPTADNEVYNVTYKDKGISNIVFYKECENIDGLTAVSAGNVPARCSNGKGAMAEAATTIATLAPGKYKIAGFAWGNSGTEFKLTANGTTVATLTTASSTVNVSTSEEFSVAGTTDIVLGAQGNGGSSPKVIDFIYIQKTGDVDLPANATATLGKNGYTTFASAYDLDLSNLNGFKAYTATLSGAELSFTECTSKVVAGTGLLLKGAADAEVEIPVATADAAAVSGNALTGVTADTDLKSDADGNYIFVMKKAASAADALTFLPLTTESEVTVPAGKAYVTVPATAFGGGARALNVSFGNEATGINAVEAAAQKEGAYNLNGQRVMQPTKGLYIVNGKKVIINK